MCKFSMNKSFVFAFFAYLIRFYIPTALRIILLFLFICFCYYHCSILICHLAASPIKLISYRFTVHYGNLNVSHRTRYRRLFSVPASFASSITYLNTMSRRYLSSEHTKDRPLSTGRLRTQCLFKYELKYPPPTSSLTAKPVHRPPPTA